MPEIRLFCEDSFHEKFIGALLKRFEDEYRADVTSRFLSAQGGLSKMHGELKYFLRDLENDRQRCPDSHNCRRGCQLAGYNGRKNLMENVVKHFPRFQQLVSYAIPDPHIETVDACGCQSISDRVRSRLYTACGEVC